VVFTGVTRARYYQVRQDTIGRETGYYQERQDTIRKEAGYYQEGSMILSGERQNWSVRKVQVSTIIFGGCID